MNIIKMKYSCAGIFLSLCVASEHIQYMIIAPEIFSESAELISQLHSQDVEFSQQLITAIKYVEDIYDEFPNVNPDQAIREFLLDIIDTDLEYLLLLGDESLIPPIYNPTHSDADYPDGHPSDDYYSSEQPLTAIPQLSTGRIPVADSETSFIIAEKIRNYILYPTYGAWRSKLALIADDQFKEGSFNSSEFSHTTNSDILYNMLSDDLNIQQFYGSQYTPNEGADGLLQPDLTQDVLDMINSGVAMLNYIGHGSEITLSGEKILHMPRDMGHICSAGTICAELNQPPIWVVGTCSFGEYDQYDAMSEALIQSEFGAIALVTTVRNVGTITNINYLESFFGEISEFVNSDVKERLGDIVKASKANGGNYYLFHLFGDPALPLPFPRKSYSIVDSPWTDTLQVLTQENIQSNSTDTTYMKLSVSDQIITQEFDGYVLSFTQQGNVVYQGSFIDESCFRISLDVPICEDCTLSMLLYTDENQFNGEIQFISDIPLKSFSGNLTDNSGPIISVFQGNVMLNNGSMLHPGLPLTINLYDESGINVMYGFQHNIRYWFDDPMQSYSILPDLFQYDNSCSEGNAEFSLPLNVIGGQHELFVEAWDNANNRSEIQLTINIVDEIEQLIHTVYNIPNPVNDYTYFTFYLTQYPADVSIDVYTPHGQKVKSIPEQTFSNNFNTIYWDTKGNHQNVLANGAYLYHLKANSGESTYENIFKMAILK